MAPRLPLGMRFLCSLSQRQAYGAKWMGMDAPQRCQQQDPAESEGFDGCFLLFISHNGGQINHNLCDIFKEADGEERR